MSKKMKLPGLPTRDLSYPRIGFEISIRPLNERDIAYLYATNAAEIEALFAALKGSVAGFDVDSMVETMLSLSDNGDVTAVLGTALDLFPALLNTIIAIAADEPEIAPRLVMVPVSERVDVLINVFSLTQEWEGDLGKLWGVVLTLAKALWKKIPEPLRNGSSTFAA